MLSYISTIFSREFITWLPNQIEGKFIIFLVITLIGECLTAGRDNRNRNKTAIAEFRKIMSEEREKVIKNSVMDINRQENTYSTLYHQLFVIQKIRISMKWNKYIETEKKQKEYIKYWVLYHNKSDVIKCLDALIKLN
ncbi:MAG: hypothetical protein WC001_05280 [Desulfurivibrionaceae bacterium]